MNLLVIICTAIYAGVSTGNPTAAIGVMVEETFGLEQYTCSERKRGMAGCYSHHPYNKRFHCKGCQMQEVRRKMEEKLFPE